MEKEIKLDKETFKALAGETRVEILRELDQRRKTQTELAKLLSLSTPTVKEHLELLEKAELVKAVDDGRKWKYYELTWKGKNIINPTEVKVMLLLALSSLAFIGLAYVLFSQALFAGNQMAFEASNMDGARNSSVAPFSKSLEATQAVNDSQAGATETGAVPNETGTAGATQQEGNLPLIQLPYLAIFTVLAAFIAGGCIGFLLKKKKYYT